MAGFPGLGVIEVVGAAIVDERGRCLVAQRGKGRSNAGKWELPGGKVERREPPRAALVREIREELGIEIEVGEYIGRGVARGGPALPERKLVLDVYLARVRRGQVKLSEHAAVRWLAADQLETVDWAEADRPVLPALAARLTAIASRSGS